MRSGFDSSGELGEHSSISYLCLIAFLHAMPAEQNDHSERTVHMTGTCVLFTLSLRVLVCYVWEADKAVKALHE